MTEFRKSTSLLTLLRAAKKHKVWLVLLLVLMILVLFYSQSAKQKRRSDKGESGKNFETAGRKTFAQSDFAGPPKTSNGKPSALSGVRPVRKTRNYNTDIDVFLFKEEEKRSQSAYGTHSTALQKLNIPSGTKIPAFVKDTIFSFNVAAPVSAVITKDFELDGKVIIPKDSKFLGEAGVLKSLNRINVRFELLILPDGSERRVQAIALSEDGSAGIKGRVSKQTDMRILKAVGETALAGVSLFAGGVSRDPYSLEDNLRMNLAQNLTGQARQDLRNVKVETSVTVDGFTPIQVILLDGI